MKSNDGHDAAILVIADALKQGGIEVILGGYDLTVDKFVDAIIQEGVHLPASVPIMVDTFHSLKRSEIPCKGKTILIST